MIEFVAPMRDTANHAEGIDVGVKQLKKCHSFAYIMGITLHGT